MSISDSFQKATPRGLSPCHSFILVCSPPTLNQGSSIRPTEYGRKNVSSNIRGWKTEASFSVSRPLSLFLLAVRESSCQLIRTLGQPCGETEIHTLRNSELPATVKLDSRSSSPSWTFRCPWTQATLDCSLMKRTIWSENHQQSSETGEIINVGCFKVLSLGIICKAAIDNEYNVQW